MKKMSAAERRAYAMNARERLERIERAKTNTVVASSSEMSHGAEILMLFGVFGSIALIFGVIYLSWNDTDGMLYRWRKTQPEQPKKAIVEKKEPVKSNYSFSAANNELAGHAYTRTKQLIQMKLSNFSDIAISYPDKPFVGSYELNPAVTIVNLRGTGSARNSFGGKCSFSWFANWHYNSADKSWSCKNFSLDRQ